MQKRTIKINDYKYTFFQKLTIEDLLVYLGFNISVILINYNGALISKELIRKVFMKNNDYLEIITIAGGG
jgi:thiamine biosynthesis protein ThiS